MASIRGAILLGSTLLLAASVSAHAGGMYDGSIKDGYASAPVYSPGPTWYFRVDGGYGHYDDPIMIEDGINHLIDTEIEGHWNVGGGFGRYFTPNIRGDVTVEHRFETEVKGTLGNNAALLPGERRFGLSSTLVLANLYYDFDLRSRFTPYVGVGLGWVRHKTQGGVVDGSCGCDGTVEGDSKDSVAAAFMAGAAINLFRNRGHADVVSVKDEYVAPRSSRNLYFDVGYRFLYLGEGTSGPVRGVVNGTPEVSRDPTVEDIHAHEIRFGLRYDIN